MIKIYMLVADASAAFGPEERTYANVVKVGEYEGKTVVMIFARSCEEAYLSECAGYIGNRVDLESQYPELAGSILLGGSDPVIYAGEDALDQFFQN